MVKWMNIKEQLPPRGEGVLITDGKFVTAAERGDSYRYGWWWNEHGFRGGYEWEWEFNELEVTHWAALPKPPEPEA